MSVSWIKLSFNKFIVIALVLLIHAQAQTKAQAWKVVHYFIISVRTYVQNKTNRSKS